MTRRPCLVIAEAGVNHNGDRDKAFALVDIAAEAGADIVKFQTFRADRLASVQAPKAEYQVRQTDADESQFGMLRRLELSHDMHRALIDHCRARKIGFLSTPFDVESLDFLSGIGIDRVKIPSGEITNGPFLLHAARSGLPIILSTGMSTLADIEAALKVIAFGWHHASGLPNPAALESLAVTPLPDAAARITLLHCTTEYPAPADSVNLLAMGTMRQTFGLPVGLSDHTAGIAVPIAAIGLGATVIEKHFTLDRALPGPDHKASLEPDELRQMVAGIRAAEAALGQPVKRPAPVEIKNIAIARKSLVAARPIAAGEAFTAENLTAKRPGDGRSPMDYWQLLGTPATRAYAQDEAIQ